MKRFFILWLIISIHAMVFGDVQSRVEDMICESQKEFKAKNYAKALEYLIKAKTIAEDNNLPYLEMDALFDMGIIYARIADYEKSAECYLAAYQIATKNAHEKKFKTMEPKILNNISTLYMQNKDFYNAKEYLYKAYQVSLQLQDSLLAGTCAINLVVCANKTENFEEAEKYLNRIEILFKNQTIEPSGTLRMDTLSLSLLLKAIRMEHLYLKKEYNQAEQLALEILNKKLNFLDVNNTIAETFLYLSRIYQHKKEYQKAIVAAKDALDNCSKLPLIVEIYEQLSNLYHEIGDTYLAYQYLHDVITTKDSLSKTMKMTDVMMNQVKLDLSNSEKAFIASQAKQRIVKIIIIFVIALVVIAVLVLIILFLQKQKRLKNEIEEKNQQLMAKILFQTSKNELIQELIAFLAETLQPSEDPTLRVESAIGKLKKIQIKESTEWKGYLTYFDQIHPAFVAALKKKHPNLTTDEIRFASYIYLNLDMKEIARLFNIEPDSCRKKKHRLAQKLNVPTYDIHKYLTAFFDKVIK